MLLSPWWEPPADVDPELLKLLQALNSLPGIRTSNSCCGHGKAPMRVWLRADGPRSLLPIGWALDKRYQRRAFTCTVDITDMPADSVLFLLESKEIGPPAYLEAEKLAADFEEFLGHEGCRRSWQI